jgi:hypothetical protein
MADSDRTTGLSSRGFRLLPDAQRTQVSSVQTRERVLRDQGSRTCPVSPLSPRSTHCSTRHPGPTKPGNAPTPAPRRPLRRARDKTCFTLSLLPKTIDARPGIMEVHGDSQFSPVLGNALCDGETGTTKRKGSSSGQTSWMEYCFEAILIGHERGRTSHNPSSYRLIHADLVKLDMMASPANAAPIGSRK